MPAAVAGACPARLVDYQETSSQRFRTGPEDDLAVNRLRAGQLQRIATECDAEGREDDALRHRRHAARLASCGDGVVCMVGRETGKPKAIPLSCRSRLCPGCSRRRALLVAERITEHVKRMDGRRFLTLTLKSSDAPLSETIKRLHASWRRLRRVRWFAARVTGGVYVTEITYRRRRDGWHAHLHAIISGDLVPKAMLREEWKRITGDSFIVDIRAVYSADSAGRELSTYVSKVGKPMKLPIDRMEEYIDAVTSLRMVQTFGRSHGEAVAPPDDEDREKLSRICFLSFLTYWARWGDREAAALEAEWKRLLADPDASVPGDLAVRTERAVELLDALKWWRRGP